MTEGTNGDRVPDDLALIAARLGAGLREAGVPADPGRCERFARAVPLARPATRYELYLCALATFASSPEQIETVQQVFRDLFGGAGGRVAGPGGPDQPGPPHRPPADDLLAGAARAAQDHPASPPGTPPGADGADGPDRSDGAGGLVTASDAAEPGSDDQPETARAALASRAERLAGTDFADLTPAELQDLAGLMRELTLAVPLRRSRREHPSARGRRTDLRSTLRHARRTGGHPLRLARRTPALRPRQLIVLCDISGSMEPYARAMLQLLYCAAGGGQAEVFTFATRLTRLTGALAHMPPEQALQRAGQAAPDWLGGTRIGASLKEFNDTAGPSRPGPGSRRRDHLGRLGHRGAGRAAPPDAAAVPGRAPDHLGQPPDQERAVPPAGRRDGRGLAVLRRGAECAFPARPARTDGGAGPARPAPSVVPRRHPGRSRSSFRDKLGRYLPGTGRRASPGRPPLSPLCDNFGVRSRELRR